jgi:hypothetical protein
MPSVPRNPKGQEMADQPPDFTPLDDSALLLARSEMRAELERLPPRSARHAALMRVYDLSTTEIDERARRAWTQAG